VLLEAGGGLVEVCRGEGGTVVTLNRALIESIGIPAMAAFLLKLQVYKATAGASLAHTHTHTHTH
jgi:hypothetical protein